MKGLRHLLIIAASLFLFLGIPLFANRSLLVSTFGGGTVDALTGATLELPDQPSGEYLVLINKAKHRDTLREWTDFFQERPVPVIFEDISCITPDIDTGGLELAQRYQARLAENQMTVKTEAPLLAMSKAQWGHFDILILSKEVADALGSGTLLQNLDVEFVPVKGA